MEMSVETEMDMERDVEREAGRRAEGRAEAEREGGRKRSRPLALPAVAGVCSLRPASCGLVEQRQGEAAARLGAETGWAEYDLSSSMIVGAGI